MTDEDFLWIDYIDGLEDCELDGYRAVEPIADVREAIIQADEGTYDH